MVEAIQVSKPLLRGGAKGRPLSSATLSNDAFNHIVRTEIPWTSAIIAIVILILVIVLIVVFAFVNVYINDSGLLSNSNRLLYVMGTTLLATLIASFTSGTIRQLWISSSLRYAREEDAIGNGKKEYAKARNILGLSSIKDKIRSWEVTISLSIAALMTTAIVASVTPTDCLVNTSTVAVINLDATAGPGFLDPNWGSPDPTNYTCIFVSENDYGPTGFSWQMPNGSYISITRENDDELRAALCPITNVEPTIVRQGLLAPETAYVMGGVTIGDGASGTPSGLTTGLDYSFGIFQDGEAQSMAASSLEWATQCLPVVSSNPVQCVGGGTVGFEGANLVVTYNECSISRYGYTSLNTFNTFVSGACTGGLEIGKATVLLGAINDTAWYLASAMGAHPEPDYFTSHYSVVCTIDIAPSISFAELNLSRVGNSNYGSSYSAGWRGDEGGPFQVAANTDNAACTPLSPSGDALTIENILTATMLATGSAASLPFLTTNPVYSGWFETWLAQQYQVFIDSYYFWNMPNYTWPDSHNYVADTLGLASAISLAYFWGAFTGLPGDLTNDPNILQPLGPVQNMTATIGNGVKRLSGVRVGPGVKAVAYTAPEVFAVGLILWLSWDLKRLEVRARAAKQDQGEEEQS